MAGTLTISTLSDGTNSTSATNCIQGSARAFVNFNGITTATIRQSYNVSSVTRNSTGDYTINFTNAFANTNYTPFGWCKGGDSASVLVSVLWPAWQTAANTYGTTFIRVVSATTNTGTLTDCYEITVCVLTV
jgi:hypothetical protein